jgi:hypothetical protein
MPRFLSKMRELCPQHFAFVCLGFFLGHRPSTLRPLRRSGPTPDVLLEQGLLLIHHYSSVGAAEKQTAIAKVIELAGVRKALPEGASALGGMHGGMHDPENKKAARH